MEEASEEQLSESSTKVDCGSRPFAAVFSLMICLIGDTAALSASCKSTVAREGQIVFLQHIATTTTYSVKKNPYLLLRQLT